MSATSFRKKSITPPCNGLDVSTYAAATPIESLASKSDDVKELGLLRSEVEELRKKLEGTYVVLILACLSVCQYIHFHK